MDPTAALNALIDCANETDSHQAYEHADALVVWLQKGGFMPDREALIRLFVLIRDASGSLT